MIKITGCPFLIVEKFADNGEHSHWELINLEGETVWSEGEEEPLPMSDGVNEKREKRDKLKTIAEYIQDKLINEGYIFRPRHFDVVMDGLYSAYGLATSCNPPNERVKVEPVKDEQKVINDYRESVKFDNCAEFKIIGFADGFQQGKEYGRGKAEPVKDGDAGKIWDAGFNRGFAEGADIDKFTNHPDKETFFNSLKLSAPLPANKNNDAAINLLKEYEKWEADLIADNQLWWPNVDKDAIRGKTYDKMLELQEKRNEILKTNKK